MRPFGMRRRFLMGDHAGKVAAIYPAATRHAPDEIVDLVCRRTILALTDELASWYICHLKALHPCHTKCFGFFTLTQLATRRHDRHAWKRSPRAGLAGQLRAVRAIQEDCLPASAPIAAGGWAKTRIFACFMDKQAPGLRIRRIGLRQPSNHRPVRALKYDQMT